AFITGAVRRRNALVLDYPRSGAPASRHAFFGDPWSVVVVPIEAGGRTLGSIELVDPRVGSPFGEAAVDSLKYIAGRYSKFIKEHGIDVSKIVNVSELE